MQRIEVNVQTGEQTIVDLTPDEVVAAQAQYAAWELDQQNKPQPTPLEKLQASGLTVLELKQLLGLN